MIPQIPQVLSGLIITFRLGLAMAQRKMTPTKAPIETSTPKAITAMIVARIGRNVTRKRFDSLLRLMRIFSFSGFFGVFHRPMKYPTTTITATTGIWRMMRVVTVNPVSDALSMSTWFTG